MGLFGNDVAVADRGDRRDGPPERRPEPRKVLVVEGPHEGSEGDDERQHRHEEERQDPSRLEGAGQTAQRELGQSRQRQAILR